MGRQGDRQPQPGLKRDLVVETVRNKTCLDHDRELSAERTSR